MKRRSSLWGRTGVTGEIDKAKLQLERAKIQRQKAEEITENLAQERSRNGYAQMVMEALGGTKQ